MGEVGAIAATLAPHTRQSLAKDFREVGLETGSTVVVHASLSAIGWVAGGAVAVIQALFDAVGPTGTLVMPAHTGQLTDPANWKAPPVPADWVDTLHAATPAFDPATTPTRGMGAIAELFRTWPNTRRSNHPHCSFSANGPAAGALLENHTLESPTGEHSPLAKLYECNAAILLLGVGFDNCTMLHLAEVRAWPNQPMVTHGAPLFENGERKWVEFKAPPVTGTDHFVELGSQLIDTERARSVRIGSADAVIVPARTAVDDAVSAWCGQQPPR